MKCAALPGDCARNFSASEVKLRVQPAHSQDLELGVLTPAAFLVEPEAGEAEPPSDVDPVRRGASFELILGRLPGQQGSWLEEFRQERSEFCSEFCSSSLSELSGLRVVRE